MKHMMTTGVVAALLLAADATTQWRQTYETAYTGGTHGDYHGYRVDVAGGMVITGSVGGGVHILEKSPYFWTETRSASGSSTRFYDYAGVAMSGDGYAFAGGVDSSVGADIVQVFEKNASMWASLQRIDHPTGRDGILFGQTLGAHADYLIVGATHDTPDGAAYVYARNVAGDYVRQAELRSTTNTFDFGDDVDITAVGTSRFAIVGDPNRPDASGSWYQGAAVIYREDAVLGWVEDRTLTGAAPGDYFGSAVAISGRWAAVGVPGATGPSGEQGAVHVYFCTASGTWLKHAELFASDLDDRLGHAVDIDGDLLVAGAQFNLDNSGAAYVFQRSTGAWIEEERLRGTGIDAGDQFGNDVAIDGENEIIVVGAPMRDAVAGTETGSAFIFERPFLLFSVYFGEGVPHSDNLPRIHASAMRQSGDPLVIAANGLRASLPAVLVIGLPTSQPISLEPIGGQSGSALLIAPLITQALLPDAEGQAASVWHLPPNWDLRQPLAIQAFQVDPQLPFALPVAHSAGLVIGAAH